MRGHAAAGAGRLDHSARHLPPPCSKPASLKRLPQLAHPPTGEDAEVGVVCGLAGSHLGAGFELAEPKLHTSKEGGSSTVADSCMAADLPTAGALEPLCITPTVGQAASRGPPPPPRLSTYHIPTLVTEPSAARQPPFWEQNTQALQPAVDLQLSQQAPASACSAVQAVPERMQSSRRAIKRNTPALRSHLPHRPPLLLIRWLPANPSLLPTRQPTHPSPTWELASPAFRVVPVTMPLACTKQPLTPTAALGLSQSSGGRVVGLKGSSTESMTVM